MSRLLFLSDLHLASSEKVDNFGESAKIAFEKLIEWKNKNNIDRGYVIGDIFELFQGKGWSEKKRLKLARKRYAKIWDEIKSKDWQLIAGNHDMILNHKENIPTSIIIEPNSKVKIAVLHGHIFDPIYKDESKIGFVGRIATEVWGVVESLIGVGKASKTLRSFKQLLERKALKHLSRERGNRATWNQTMYLNKSIEYGKTISATHVIMGHIHRNDDKKIGGVHYINTNKWTDGGRTIVVIDTKMKKLLITEFTNKVAKESLDKLLKTKGRRL